MYQHIIFEGWTEIGDPRLFNEFINIFTALIILNCPEYDAY